jgi:hypothetical protein
MLVIPWGSWNYSMTSRLMRWNYWCNKEEFDRLLADNAEARKNW